MERPYELAWTPDGMVARVRLRGNPVLSSPLLNQGTAFTLAEREALGLTSLRDVSAAVATAVAHAAQAEGLAQNRLDDPAKHVAEAMWLPAYPVIEAI